MPSLYINDFGGGIDLRRGAVTAPTNSMRDMQNCIINNGGEIEKRKMLAPYEDGGGVVGGARLANTFGLFGSAMGCFVFGSVAAPPNGAFSPNFQYHRITGAPAAITRIRAVEAFAGKLFVISELATGALYYSYDGVAATNVPAGVSAVKVVAARMWGVSSSLLAYSALNNPADWTAGGATAGGVIELDRRDAGTFDARALEIYYDKLLVLGRRASQIWSVDPDPALVQRIQTLYNVGVINQRAAVPVGDGDVMSLSEAGLRSIRARSNDLNAAMTDAGAPIDRIIQPLMASKFSDIINRRAHEFQAATDPETGAAWFTAGDTVYVLSMAPSARISAWARFTLPSAIEYITVYDGRIFIRDATQTISVYGGTTGDRYDATPATFTTPFYSAGDPSMRKQWLGLDVAAERSWLVEACCEPQLPNVWQPVAEITGPTFTQHTIPLPMVSTHMALRFTSRGSTVARVGQIGLHFNAGSRS